MSKLMYCDMTFFVLPDRAIHDSIRGSIWIRTHGFSKFYNLELDPWENRHTDNPSRRLKYLRIYNSTAGHRYSWLPAVRPRISQTVRLFGSSPCQCISLFFHFVHMGKVCSKFTPRRDIKVLAMTYIVQENPNIHELIRLIVGFHDLHDDKVCLQPVTIDRGCLRLKTVFLAL